MSHAPWPIRINMHIYFRALSKLTLSVMMMFIFIVKLWIINLLYKINSKIYNTPRYESGSYSMGMLPWKSWGIIYMLYIIPHDFHGNMPIIIIWNTTPIAHYHGNGEVPIGVTIDLTMASRPVPTFYRCYNRLPAYLQRDRRSRQH